MQTQDILASICSHYFQPIMHLNKQAIFPGHYNLYRNRKSLGHRSIMALH